jgi:hypothetical protein
MKSIIIGAALLAATLPALAQTNVSINVGQPGFYGRIDIGNYAPPPVVYAQPVIIQPAPRYAAQPVYLRVPPGHRKHWDRNCARYNACGQRVLFVRDEWYTNTYAPRYREHHGREYRAYQERGPERHEYRDERGHGRGGHDRGDDRGHGRGDDDGRGNGHGNGHGRGHD